MKPCVPRRSSWVFNRLGLDTCCGGALTLGEAARSAGLTPDELRAELGPALETHG